MAEENIINVVYNRLKHDKEKIECNEFEKIEVDAFNLNDFWTQFGASVQALSNEVTKIGFVCGNKPFPKNNELESMLQNMVQCYNVMRDLYSVLPKEVGEEVFKAVTDSLLNIMSALLSFVGSLHDLSDKGTKDRLTLTGTFWDACTAVELLPRSNLQATLKVLDGEIALAADAQEELSTTVEEDRVNMSEMGFVDNSDMWTNEERDLALKAVGLVKVTHVCLQKLHNAVRNFGSCSTPQNCAQLDQIACAVRTVSPALDNFVSELYHPVDFPTTIENAGKLVGVLHSLLCSIKGTHFEKGISKDVFNKLLQFISHNHSKLDPAVTDLVLDLNSLHT